MRLPRLFGSMGLVLVLLFGVAFVPMSDLSQPRINLGYQKAGLTARQAAAHLLSRFSFGAKPGEVDAVMNMGLEQWLEQQLAGNLPDAGVTDRLSGYDALSLSNEQIVNTYLNAGQVIRLAVKNNLISRDSLQTADKKEYRAQVQELMRTGGYKPLQELQRQLINQKVIRAAYSKNQLHEVLTDFWFNHFNVSLTKGQSVQYVMSYERDAIRPHVTGRFQDLLVATAKHPAMLQYLDNALSVSDNNPFARRQASNPNTKRIMQRMETMAKDTSTDHSFIIQQVLKAKKMQGLNENYAREIMELHTLGVEGGYTQKDVTEVARALTGWGVKPMFKEAPGKQQFDRAMAGGMGQEALVSEGDFIYRGNKHDEDEKIILGKFFPANGGYAEGMKVLQMLANHPSTAHFISQKLAVRFVADTPSVALVNSMAKTFKDTQGDIMSVLITMVNSTEFWNGAALRGKVKSPFEYAISTVRATNAEVTQPFQLFNWCMKMGQRFYFYQAPTGFPDRASYWINTGSLLNRMNFGLAFATQKIPGVTLNLAALNNNQEPESAEAALAIYGKLLLPERNQDANTKRLTALVRDEKLEEKISAAAVQNMVPAGAAMELEMDEMMEPAGRRKNNNASEKAALGKNNKSVPMMYTAGNNSTISQVTGIILGSPEFQRK